MAEGKSEEEFLEDRPLQLALVGLLEIIGEAANRVPPEDRGRFPGIAWPDIVALRKRLIHGYDAVDLSVVWRIIQFDVPELVAELERGLGREELP
jgi:uncharacterized protein with HEPN domain